MKLIISLMVGKHSIKIFEDVYFDEFHFGDRYVLNVGGDENIYFNSLSELYSYFYMFCGCIVDEIINGDYNV